MKKTLFVLPFLLACSLLFTCCSKSDNGGSPDPDPEPDPDPVVQADIPQVDDAVNTFMTKYSVPGLALAITYKGKLVYLKDYGMADKEAETPVSTNSLFRIASVSKPITSIAIMKLVEDGKLSLSDKVFGTGAILGTTYGTTPYSANITDITVSQLLHHTSGGWPNDGTDPMFSNPDMNQAELISWTLNNRPLQYTPGTHYAYSNFGYCVLGRVIEKLSGKSYDAYVKEKVLQPAGITDMMISGNTLADRKTNEVKYYGQSGENPYIYKIDRMDSHGGWLASAKDLAKLLVVTDGFSTKADILSAASITAMTTASSAYSYYACGWSVNSLNNWWHNGSLPGTGSEIVRGSNQFSWSILCNTRNLSDGYATDMDQLVWIAINNSATVWQDIDQF